MRKFVVKNRQKRKYVRQQTAIFSSPDFKLMGLIPSIIIAIAVLVTVIRQPIELDVHYDPSLRLPETGWVYKDIAGSVLNIFNFIQKATYSIFKAFIDLLSQANTGLAQSVTQGSNTVAQTVQSIIQFISGSFALVAQLVIESLTAVLSFFETIIRGFVLFIADVVAMIGSAASLVVKAIKAPFIAFGRFIENTKPFFGYIGTTLKPAVNDLNTGFADLLSILNSIPKSN